MRKKDKRVIYSIFLAGILLFVLCGVSLGQEKFPTRPINFIISQEPGGGQYIMVQVLQPHAEKALGEKVLLITKPGGGGTIGLNYIANSAPDGYTCGVINPSTFTLYYINKSGLNYDKFDNIIRGILQPAAVVVKADSQWKTLREFLDYGKAHPEKIRMGNSGHSRMWHVGAVGIEMATGAKFTHMPFKGTGPSITALLGGHIEAILSDIAAVVPHVEAKKLRILAVSSSRRNTTQPDLPTYNMPIFKDFGFDLDMGTWYVYVVPKGTPKDRTKILHDALKVALDSREVQDYAKKQGGTIEHLSRDGLEAFLSEQDRLWKKIIDFGKFKPTE